MNIYKNDVLSALQSESGSISNAPVRSISPTFIQAKMRQSMDFPLSHSSLSPLPMAKNSFSDFKLPLLPQRALGSSVFVKCVKLIGEFKNWKFRANIREAKEPEDYIGYSRCEEA